MLTRSDIIVCAVTGAVMLLLLAMSIALLRGKGAWLIAGYNTMGKKEREKYDVAALCRFMGRYLLSVTLLLPAIPIGGIFKVNWLPLAFGLYVAISAMFVIVYCNTGNRFRK